MSAIMQPNTKKPPGAIVRMPMGFSWNHGTGRPQNVPQAERFADGGHGADGEREADTMPAPSMAESTTPCLLAYIFTGRG